MKILPAAQHRMLGEDKFINVGEIISYCSDHLKETREETDTFGILAELN